MARCRTEPSAGRPHAPFRLSRRDRSDRASRSRKWRKRDRSDRCSPRRKACRAAAARRDTAPDKAVAPTPVVPGSTGHLDPRASRLRQIESPCPMGDRALRGGRLADGQRHRQRPGRAPDRSRGRNRSLRVGRSGALPRDRGGHDVAPDRCRSIAGSDVQTYGARPTRHRRFTSDHIAGLPRHPCGARRAYARRVAGGDGRTRTDAPSVRSVASRG